MLETLSNCPICQSDNIADYRICQDFMVSQEKFTISKCERCGFLFTNPRPDLQHISAYYKSNDYISHTDKSNNLTNTIYKFVRHFTIKHKVKLISSIADEKSILDFGCGTGDLLNAFRKKNWTCYGFEPDIEASKLAGQKTGINIFNQTDQIHKLENLSVITLWHVLEHVHQLNETIDILIDALSENGKLLIAVPNQASYDALHYKSYWAAYDVPRHLYHFTQESMHKLMQLHGLKIIDILPMKLDSFYVSLLSEKYQFKQSNFVKSFINGCKSNIYANKHQNNYSSLIYIVKK